MERVYVSIDPSGAFLPGTLREAAIPSEVVTPGRCIPEKGNLMPYERVQSKAGTLHRRQLITSEVVALRSIPETGDASPRKKVYRSKAGELHRHGCKGETQRMRVGTEGTRSAHERRRKIKDKSLRKLRTLVDEVVRCSSTIGIAQKMDSAKPVKSKIAFVVRFRGMEHFMRQIAAKGTQAEHRISRVHVFNQRVLDGPSKQF